VCLCVFVCVCECKSPKFSATDVFNLLSRRDSITTRSGIVHSGTEHEGPEEK